MICVAKHGSPILPDISVSSCDTSHSSPGHWGGMIALLIPSFYTVSAKPLCTDWLVLLASAGNATTISPQKPGIPMTALSSSPSVLGLCHREYAPSLKATIMSSAVAFVIGQVVGDTLRPRDYNVSITLVLT